MTRPRRRGPSRRAAVAGGLVFAGVLAIGLAMMPGADASAESPTGNAVPATLERIAARNEDAAARAAAQQRARSQEIAEAADAAQARREAEAVEAR